MFESKLFDISSWFSLLSVLVSELEVINIFKLLDTNILFNSSLTIKSILFVILSSIFSIEKLYVSISFGINFIESLFKSSKINFNLYCKKILYCLLCKK